MAKTVKIKISSINIDASNKDAIEAALAEYNGKLEYGAISAADVIYYAQDAEKKLTKQLGIAVSNIVGAKYRYRRGGNGRTNYNYPKTCLDLTIVRKRAGWFIESIDRVGVFPAQDMIDDLIITPTIEDKAIAALRKHYRVATPVVKLDAETVSA